MSEETKETELTAAAVEGMKGDDLRDALRARKLPVSGTVAELQERLKAAVLPPVVPKHVVRCPSCKATTAEEVGVTGGKRVPAVVVRRSRVQGRFRVRKCSCNRCGRLGFTDTERLADGEAGE